MEKKTIGRGDRDDRENVLCLTSLAHDKEIADYGMQCITYHGYDG
jgi:hypothetical protein